MTLTLESNKLNDSFIVRYMGISSPDKKYREFVTPMLAIGEKLTGKFTAQAFVPLKTGGYYYNPDKRCSDIVGGCEEDRTACQLFNTLTIKTMSDLFTKYNQEAVIVTEGYDHIQAVAKELMSEGYKAGPLIISKDLKSRRKKDPKLKTFLKDIESDKKETAQMCTMEVIRKRTYALIAHPIDLKAIFDAQLQTSSAPRQTQMSSTASSAAAAAASPLTGKEIQ